MAAILLLCATSLVWAGGEGGADYAYPFAAGAILQEHLGANPLATVTVVEITGADLVAQGAETAADALALAPGAFSYQADRWPGQGGRHVRLRGAGPRGLVVYVDGVPLTHGYLGAVDLNAIPADQIRLMRVYPGPAPFVFGAESGGGVVEILTRQAGDRIKTRFDGRFGDRRRKLFSFGIGGDPEWASYWASASYDGVAGVPLPLGFDRTLNEDGGRLDGSGYARHHYRARFGGRIGETGEVHGSVFMDRTDRDVPYDVVNPLNEVRRFPEDQRLGGVINWRAGGFGPFHAGGEAYIVEFFERREDFADRDYLALLRERRYRHVRSGLGVTPFFDFGQESRVTTRLSLRQDEIEAFVQDLDAPRDRFTIQRFEALLGDDIAPLPWLQLNFGGGFRSVDPVRATNFEPGDPVTGPFARAGLGFGPFSGLALRLAYAQHPQFPTVEEWFDEDLGNPDLDAAVIDNAELGATWKTAGKTRVDLVGFWRQTRDDIVVVPDEQRDRFANDLNWVTLGATLTASTAPLKGLYLGVQGTFQDFDDPDADENMQLIYTPNAYGAFDARYRFGFGLGGALQVQVVGERSDFEAGRDVTLEAYSLTNLRLFYSYRDWVEVYAQGKNLFDTAYETKRFFPEPGRIVTAGLKLTY
ncbi:MAG: TonB-dependent receptor [Candidatus Lernaella stagnicola]|nr:TonB-dependent receptor [Candidatus Lernaella stagnicola]